jgi:hypothetical protein
MRVGESPTASALIKKGGVYRIYNMYIMYRGGEESTCLGGAKN